MKRTPLGRNTRPKRRRSKHTLLLDDARSRYEELIQAQAQALGWPAELAERCAICLKAPTPGSRRKRLDIDHNHSPRHPTLRGLICARCNRSLPYFITPSWLRAAADYLENPPLRMIDEREAA